MVSKKVTLLKDSLHSHSAMIYDLCIFVVQGYRSHPGSVNVSLLTTGLSALADLLEWFPLGYIIETKLILMLLRYFMDLLEYRIQCTKRLIKIACFREGVQQ